MGNAPAKISEEQLEIYQDETFFTRKEILAIFERFSELNPHKVEKAFEDGNINIKLDREEIYELEELKFSPFKDRICQIFSEDQSGDMTFGDFLDMLSVMSQNATAEIKAAYAFKIYDFNNDGALDRTDIEDLVNRVTGGKMDTSDVDGIVDTVLKEIDLEENGLISPQEFESAISKSTDFFTKFHIEV